MFDFYVNLLYNIFSYRTKHNKKHLPRLREKEELMRHTITTSLGNFNVELSYQPTADDLILNRFTAVLNRYAMQPLVLAADEHPELDTVKDAEKLQDLAFHLLTKEDEAEIEKSLYDSTRVADGAGRRLTFSLYRREIEVSTF